MGLMGVVSVSNIQCEGMAPKHSQKGIIYNSSERQRHLYVAVQMEFQSLQLQDYVRQEPQKPKTTEIKKFNHGTFDSDRFHFVLHDIQFRANEKGGKEVTSMQPFTVKDGEEELHETHAKIVLKVYDSRASNGYLYGISKPDKLLGTRTIFLRDFVKSDGHYYVHDFGLDMLQYNRGDSNIRDIRKLAVKLEWRLAKERV